MIKNRNLRRRCTKPGEMEKPGDFQLREPLVRCSDLATGTATELFHQALQVPARLHQLFLEFHGVEPLIGTFLQDQRMFANGIG